MVFRYMKHVTINFKYLPWKDICGNHEMPLSYHLIVQCRFLSYNFCLNDQPLLHRQPCPVDDSLLPPFYCHLPEPFQSLANNGV